MIILNRPQTNPYFNLAAEEYLVKQTKEPLFMFWQNTSSIVIGKHQNALKEINFNFLLENKIPVIRRISGGGTVYHDLGNLNYSFINFGARESLVNFKKYSQPILDVLFKLGVGAQLVGKSDLKINGLKFSGNASHVFKNKVLHHGTILFNSELNILSTSLQSKTISFKDKAVSSNPSLVTNIQSHLSFPISIEEFRQKIYDYIMETFPSTSIRDFTQDEIDEIQVLADEKYKTWEWNFGYSPPYLYKGIIKRNIGSISFQLFVKNGKIDSIIFESNQDEKIFKLQEIITGQNHHLEIFSTLYDDHNKLFIELNITKTNFLNSFFE